MTTSRGAGIAAGVRGFIFQVMSNIKASAALAADDDLLSYADARTLAVQGGALSTLFQWVDTYPMNGHSELGRAGFVCPCTRQARRLDTIRLGVCQAAAQDEDPAYSAVRRGFAALPRIPAPARPHARTRAALPGRTGRPVYHTSTPATGPLPSALRGCGRAQACGQPEGAGGWSSNCRWLKRL